MRNKIFLLLLSILIIGLVSSIPTCSDTNEQDISKVPCIGLTIPINCSGNITAYNTTDPSINFTFETNVFTGNVYNFTLNLTRGSYELIDCENNTATFIIGLVEQGYGTILFIIIFPCLFLTLISLFVSGRMFSRFRDEDEENEERLEEENDSDSFIPKNRLLPLIFMLMSFIPMIFMVASVDNYLEEYLPTMAITTAYGSFYILFSYLFFFVFLISFVIWGASFIKMRRVMRGLDDID